MCLSIFYSQVMGLWIFFVALAMIVYHVRFKKVVLESLNHPALVTFSGFISLLLGLLVVLSHNIWVPAWPILVTLIGWILLIQGLLRIFWPETFAKMVKEVIGKSGYTVWTWVWLVVGLYLIWVGFGNPR